MNAVDTNVLLYTCDKSDVRRHATARAVIRETKGGVILWQVAAEFVAAARRLEIRGFTREIAWARLKNFLRVYRLVFSGQGLKTDGRDSCGFAIGVHDIPDGVNDLAEALCVELHERTVIQH
jgi:predicted nucleic acid-binding protein